MTNPPTHIPFSALQGSYPPISISISDISKLPHLSFPFLSFPLFQSREHLIDSKKPPLGIFKGGERKMPQGAVKKLSSSGLKAGR